MAFMRKLTALTTAAEAGRRYARKHPDKVQKATQRAAAFVDKRTKGKYHDKIDDAVRKVQSATRGRPDGRSDGRSDGRV
ncbi:antitoxin protein of toxin-antitoxin system [Herbihabitans rhizosphaerae]|uniref:Antitoxin protein of toxin-antitoxin system n=1 Tax=Herbihabitans rhizosphaerae TaxID=1872711 RepID=A0A4Q7L5N6_9PSEU|nr:antitoxin [Herbihabitans rhizosphaerae]RZS44130.1 antitoxin protein of toxin-antitoxin system [Herbihabitans rhizosphaerae]